MRQMGERSIQYWPASIYSSRTRHQQASKVIDKSSVLFIDRNKRRMNFDLMHAAINADVTQIELLP